MAYNSLQIFNDIVPQRVLSGFGNNLDFSCVYELRIVVGARALALCYDGTRIFGARVLADDVNYSVAQITGNSLYAYNDYLLEGYLPYKGLRIGVVGEVVRNGDKIVQIKDLSALVIRIPHEIKGCADDIFDKIYNNGSIRSTLICSPPACGKTTILREIARKLSNMGVSVVVLDYKNELSATFNGKAHLDVGESCVLVSSPREWGLECAVRNLAPEVIITDEIYSEAEISALKRAISSGIMLVASIHTCPCGNLPDGFDLYVELPRKIGGKKVIRQKECVIR